jgi:hypothetical protein
MGSTGGAFWQQATTQNRTDCCLIPFGQPAAKPACLMAVNTHKLHSNTLPDMCQLWGFLLCYFCSVASSVRQQLLPNCQPTYAGYLAWRGTAALDSLSSEVQHHLADKGTLYKVR